MNNFIIINQDQASQVSGFYGEYSQIRPMPIEANSYIIPERVLDDVDLGSYNKIMCTNVGINVKNYGAVGDGSANDTSAIQSCIDYLNSAGGGIMQIPTGTYLVDSITLKSNIKITGEGERASVLRGNSAVNVVELSDGAEYSEINNITVDGNSTSVNGVNLNRTTRFAGWNKLTDVEIVNCNGDGLNIGTNIIEAKITRVKSSGNGGSGISINSASSDNMLIACTSFNNGGNGYFIEGYNNKITACKAFMNGSLSSPNNGYHITGRRNTLYGCEAQDNFGNGLHIFECASNAITGFISDCNGYIGGDAAPQTPEYYGAVIENCGTTMIEGVFCDYRKSVFGNSTQKGGINVINSNKINIVAVCLDMPNYIDVDQETINTGEIYRLLNGVAI